MVPWLFMRVAVTSSLEPANAGIPLSPVVEPFESVITPFWSGLMLGTSDVVPFGLK